LVSSVPTSTTVAMTRTVRGIPAVDKSA
jgi:hypothetical protein